MFQSFTSYPFDSMMTSEAFLWPFFCHLGGYMTSSCLAYSWVRVTPGWMEKSEVVLYRFWLGTGPMSKARLLLKWQQWLWKRALVRSSVCCCKSLRRQKQNQGSSPLSWLTKDCGVLNVTPGHNMKLHCQCCLRRTNAVAVLLFWVAPKGASLSAGNATVQYF